MNNSFYIRVGKRCFDAVVSAAGLLLLSPLLFVVAIAVRVESAGTSFFLQTRTGQDERTFRIVKFRTMRSVHPGKSPLITAAGDSRITPLGRLLRKSKIDELPQLLNVLAGDMSLVGPRPEVPKYTVLYSRQQRHVLAAKPGITGPAAITCVNEEEILAAQSDPEAYYVNTLLPAKLELDLDYCRRISFRTDLKLIAQTFGRIITRRSVTPKLLSPTLGANREIG